DPQHCIAVHLNMPLGSRPEHAEPLSDEEQAGLAAMAWFQREESGYALEQSTKPQTLGMAPNDSPPGLLAWVLRKFHTRRRSHHARDRLLTNVMLYWATQTITSSIRLYWESRQSGALQERPAFVAAPTGVARYPKEDVLRFPRAWVAQQYNVTHWAVMPRGGH